VAAFSALTASALSGDRAHARAALSMLMHWPLSSIAVVRALGALAFRPHRWAKTAHGVSARFSPVFTARPEPEQNSGR
jgi:hypothetical protein